jgi:hypothetical protein
MHGKTVVIIYDHEANYQKKVNWLKDCAAFSFADNISYGFGAIISIAQEQEFCEMFDYPFENYEKVLAARAVLAAKLPVR